jgi:ligand-binding SRPBCC domain-containing protein
MALFEDRITVARPVEFVFDFLTTSSNIEKVSQADLGLTFLEAPEKYHQGAVIKFQIMGMGQVRTAVHEVIEFDSPERFVERQIEGALKLWVHEHLFESDGQQTHIVDRITFEPPGGLLGLLATEDRILDQLEQGFFSRNRQIKRLLEQDAS